jgi:hypothetical protein
LYVIPSRARVLRVGWIGLLVVALVLSAPSVSAKKKARERRYGLPVARKWAPDRKIDNRHHDYPAWDIGIPKRTAVRAVHAGRVRAVTRRGGCGRGLIIRGRDGYEYTYCHGSWVKAKKHQWVKVGQKIMLSGNTGHSTGPHLHLQIRSPRGRLLCPQPLLRRWARGRQVSPRASTSRGCAYSADRDIYRPRRPAKRPARSAAKRAERAGGRGKKSARADERDGPHKHPGHKHPGRKHPGRKHRARGPKRDERKRSRRVSRRGGPAAERKARRRNAERRRKARAHAARVRRETAARRAELALDQRVRPLV